MMRQQTRRHISIILLSLFIGLLSMISLHGFCDAGHGDVQVYSSSHVDHHYQAHFDQGDCPVCQFLSNPFLDTLNLPRLSVISFGWLSLGVGISAILLSGVRYLRSVRAPPILQHIS